MVFHRRASADPVHDEIETGHRQGRGLGPFSSGHLTVIVVVFVVAVAFPFGAFAVTGNSVFVTDSTSGVHAKVNASGQLSVTGPVTGSVTATPTPPNSSYTKWANYDTTNEHGCVDLLTVPAGKALVIKEVVVDPWQAVANPPDSEFLSEEDGACSTPEPRFAGSVELAGLRATATLNLPQGFAIEAGHHLVLVVNESSGSSGTVWVYGYLLPAAQCTVRGNNGVAGCN
ncbi:MAG TPA: hypothetical protein VGI86_15835 [Acidimicrobiia bacterium]